MKKGLIIGIIAAVLVGIGLISYLTISNSEIKTRNLALAEQENCEIYFDKMWKILKQQAGVADQYKTAFKEIYPELIEGRYSNGGGKMMQWVQEHNPKFDASMYNKLMNSIEAQREGYFVQQKKLIDIKRTHDNLLMTAPSSWFVGSRSALEINIIKAAKTKDIYSKGEENDIDLF
jgi:hypothetical protein